jgi:3-hydroxybutyryl-CoA dehydratase
VTSLLEHDLDALRAGERFVTRGRTVTEADVTSFAALSGDMHPQHTDAEWAARSPFGTRVAHGMLVLSYAVGLLRLDPERVVALRRVRDATFKRPVAIGDTIHAKGRIDSLTPVDAATCLCSVRCDVVNQHGRVAVRATLEVLCRVGNPGGAAEPVDGAVELAGIPL